LSGSSTAGFINVDVGSSASAAASSFLTDVLQGTGVIQSADICFCLADYRNEKQSIEKK
jgi:hypothetical protein